MSDVWLAVAGALAGVITLFFGIITSVRASRTERKQIAAYSPRLRAVVQETLDERFADLTPKERERIAEELLIQLAAGLPPELRRHYVNKRRPQGAGQPRQKHLPRTVEVQREDGSTVALGIDPSDPDSISSFLRDARRVHAERVLTVQ
ncbi:MAG: hypothetical protein QOF33_2194 [Thermomicrobiales bacterium]|jgi:hypothetical protein|nr:hypothetical protein [Thermomicrobiales bacterium]